MRNLVLSILKDLCFSFCKSIKEELALILLKILRKNDLILKLKRFIKK